MLDYQDTGAATIHLQRRHDVDISNAMLREVCAEVDSLRRGLVTTERGNSGEPRHVQSFEGGPDPGQDPPAPFLQKLTESLENSVDDSVHNRRRSGSLCAWHNASWEQIQELLSTPCFSRTEGGPNLKKNDWKNVYRSGSAIRCEDQNSLGSEGSWIHHNQTGGQASRGSQGPGSTTTPDLP